MKIRCRNCGIWHATESCTDYGPVHPASGRPVSDYRYVAEAINDRVAQDIVNEHEDIDSLEEYPMVCTLSAEDVTGPCGGEVTFAPDPYSLSVYSEDTPVWMCAEHRKFRVDET